MGKKKVKIQYLLLLLMFSTIHSYSQGLFTEKIQWNTIDSVVIYKDKEQVIEWGKEQLPFSVVDLENEIIINEHKFYIIIISGYSGLIRSKIFIFKENDEKWLFIIKSNEVINPIISFRVDNEQEKIVFGTTSGKVIDTLPFDVLNDN